jgi:hypothetical protein
MNISAHFIASLILAAAVFPFLGYESAYIFIGGFLMDIDHYFWFIFKKRDLNIIRCYYFFKKDTSRTDFMMHRNSLLIFHTVEAPLILAYISLNNKFFFIVLLGLILHLIMDGIARKKMSNKLILTEPSALLYIFRKIFPKN